jgi:hypothetical protein
MRWTCFFIGFLIICNACSRKKETEYSFYYWKSKATDSDVIKVALQKAKTKTIYMHFFDVDTDNTDNTAAKDLFPKYTLEEVSPDFKQYDIVPVVYIVNNSLKNADIQELSTHIHSLIDEISEYQFHKKFKTIQLDCDWTTTTRANYFELIRLLKKFYAVNATIRLHQIKYKAETGIPPVDQGTLMLYNMGNLDSIKQNSILESSIVGDYINSSTTYPIDLDVALPLFSQTVLISKENQIRIVAGVEKASIEKDSLHFRKIDNQVFEVVQDILYKGFYLSPGYKFKFEEVSEDEIIRSYSMIKRSKIHLNNVLFYHLDDDALQHVNLDRLIQQL